MSAASAPDPLTVTSPARTLPESSGTGPSVLWLALGFLLAGLGTVLLGPILPTLARQWHLTDQQSGLLLLAKFLGAFFGGVSVPRRLRIGILSGTVLACLGFAAFALSPGLFAACAALFVSGLGLGQIIASTNILAGRRYREHTGSVLSSLNFFFSLGAVLTGLLAAAILPRFQLRDPLLSFAALFLATGLGGLLHPARRPAHAPDEAAPSAASALPAPTLLVFCLFLFLYGGLETCLTGWLTTYTLRFSDMHLLGGQSALVLLWTSLTAGRALASAALRFVSESIVQRVSLACSALLICALAMAHHGLALSFICILLGLSLAPFFPATFALLIERGPSARVAGFILAVSGLGAALFPWLMGLVSTLSGSLRVAMAVPFLLALSLLALSVVGSTRIRSAAA